ncbi:MAG TPA: NAD-dependent deacylase [Thermoanaerobaculia bacterium]|nr:NAD-dependent deacylase [Thermoanaerobaculia bacterium]
MHEFLEEAVQWIEERRPSRVAVLTGAGISAESGIPTFRDAGGLWESYRAEDLATAEAFGRDPHLVWRWYEWRRGMIRDAHPNEAHLALARLESGLAGRGELTVITQNVDGLHGRAGSREVVELHGSIFRVRCVREQTWEERLEPFETLPPHCRCGSLLRPDVVWFGEMLPPGELERAAAAVRGADVLLVIGTSGVVHPAAGLISMLERGEAIEINPQQTPISRLARFSIHDRAVSVVPRIVDAIVGSAR